MKKIFLAVTLLSAIGSMFGNQDPRTEEKQLQDRMMQNMFKDMGLENNRIIEGLKNSFNNNKANNAGLDCHLIKGYFEGVRIFEIGKGENPDLTLPENQKAATHILVMFENRDLQECVENHFEKLCKENQQ